MCKYTPYIKTSKSYKQSYIETWKTGNYYLLLAAIVDVYNRLDTVDGLGQKPDRIYLMMLDSVKYYPYQLVQGLSYEHIERFDIQKIVMPTISDYDIILMTALLGSHNLQLQKIKEHKRTIRTFSN